MNAGERHWWEGIELLFQGIRDFGSRGLANAGSSNYVSTDFKQKQLHTTHSLLTLAPSAWSKRAFQYFQQFSALDISPIHILH